MPPLSLQSGVRYAKTLLPETLVRSVSTVQSTISRHILPSAQPRCFSVCTQSRRRRRSLAASSVDELLEQAARVFVLSCQFLTLVLEEDGTVVDSDDFFQCLPNNTPLMVLEKGEMWTENKILPSFRQPKRNGIAKLTLDLYKLHPKDFLSVLRCLTYLTRLVGQQLLYISSSLLQFTGEDDC
ncbi:hypothetical protein INR49_029189 [Caranx melampygus]|nr:hypothetical protein INR49_029189 [Caranx melampygus]